MPLLTFYIFLFFICFILLTHEGSHREVYLEFQPGYDIFHRSGAKVVQTTAGSVHPQPAYTAQLLTLRQHGANNQYIGPLIKCSRLYGLAETLKQHLNSLPTYFACCFLLYTHIYLIRIRCNQILLSIFWCNVKETKKHPEY